MHDIASRRLALRALAAAVVFALLVFQIFGRASADDHSNPEGPTSALSIETEAGVFPFSVETATTEQKRELGLMYRRSMPRDRGMLFDMGESRSVTFWMHETYIPLDIIFIGASGKVVSITAEAKPRSDKLIPSGPPARFVLELNARQAAYIKLKVGDRVRHPLIDRVAGD